MNILIICMNGITSNFLKDKMQEYCNANKLDYNVKNVSYKSASVVILDADVILVAPHLRPFMSSLKSMINDNQKLFLVPPFEYSISNIHFMINEIERGRSS